MRKYLLALLLLFTLALSAHAATYTVTNSADSGAGTLRQAIIDANTNPGADTINFSISGTINITSTLEITDGDLTIDGGTNHDVAINGSGATETDPHGFEINNVGGCTLAGLVIQNCNIAIYIHGSSSDGNWVKNCYIGTNTSGDSAVPNYFGISITEEAGSNIIGTNGDGTADADEGNIISGNLIALIIFGTGTDSNWVAGNYVGLDASGTSAVSGSTIGMFIAFGAQSNIFGTNADGVSDIAERNVIAGCSFGGVGIYDANSNRVAGNYIGLDSAGTNPIPNAPGIGVGAGAKYNIIGGTREAERNVISGNTNEEGIIITETNTNSNEVIGNYIGLDYTGTTAIPNKRGVYIYDGAQSNIIGTNGDGIDDEAERNVVSGNTWAGVEISSVDSDYNRVAGNYIGLDKMGTAPVPNKYGVSFYTGVRNNIIGGTREAERNIISGNTEHGIKLESLSTPCSSNEVKGNYIGLAADGLTNLENGKSGIFIGQYATYNVIGGTTTPWETNAIAYNADYGVEINGSNAKYNKITHNSIYSNQDGGILLASGANENIQAPTILSAADGGADTIVTLSGTCGVDAGGTTVEIFESLNGQGKTYAGSTTTTDGNWSYDLNGSFTQVGKTICATATDSSNNTSEFSTEFTIPDLPAVASTAGSDTSVDESATANLVGTNSYDPNYGGMAYQWERVSGEAITIIGSTSATATFDAPSVIGDSSVTVRLTLNADASITDEVTIAILETDETSPNIDSHSPSDEAIGVSTEESVIINFDEEMDQDSAEGAFSMKGEKDNAGDPIDTPVDGSFSWSDNPHILTFTPDELQHNHTYRVDISEDAMDLVGNHLAQAFSFSFVTLLRAQETNTSVGEDNQTKVEIDQNTSPADKFSVDINLDPLSDPTEVNPTSITDAIAKVSPQDILTDTLTEINLYDESRNRISENFRAPVTLTIPYDAANAANLAIYRLDESHDLWVRVPTSQVDTSRHVVTAALQHFSVYVLMSRAAQGLKAAHAFPVPFNPGEGHTQITFTNLAQTCTIRIFTLSGDLVKTIQETDGDGQAAWDVKNESGFDIVSGVYIYHIKSEDDSKTGKLLIVR
jgi:titin